MKNIILILVLVKNLHFQLFKIYKICVPNPFYEFLIVYAAFVFGTSITSIRTISQMLCILPSFLSDQLLARCLCDATPKINITVACLGATMVGETFNLNQSANLTHCSVCRHFVRQRWQQEQYTYMNKTLKTNSKTVTYNKEE